MISERSRDTEDWSNDADNSALTTGQKLRKKKKLFNCNNFSQYYCFYCIWIK